MAEDAETLRRWRANPLIERVIQDVTAKHIASILKSRDPTSGEVDVKPTKKPTKPPAKKLIAKKKKPAKKKEEPEVEEEPAISLANLFD